MTKGEQKSKRQRKTQREEGKKGNNIKKEEKLVKSQEDETY